MILGTPKAERSQPELQQEILWADWLPEWDNFIDDIDDMEDMSEGFPYNPYEDYGEDIGMFNPTHYPDEWW